MLSSTDRTQQAYEGIITRLLRRELVRGEHLREIELAEQIGVSRTPIREALRILVTQGIVVEHRHRGRFIPKRSATEVVQLGEARQAVEGMMAGVWALRATPTAVDQLEQYAEATHQAAHREHIRAYYDTDYLFHQTLVRQCPNDYLARYTNAEALIINTFINMPYMDQIPLRERGTGDSLGDIVAAIRQRDAQAAEQAARAHLSYLAVRALRVYDDVAAAGQAPGRLEALPESDWEDRKYQADQL
jgi:DNA-binding GntR family transcriptional regulator